MTVDIPRFCEPELDCFELEAWNGGEIYRNEEYIEMDHSGERVLLEKETIIEYLSDNFEFTLELLDNVSLKKVAGHENE